MRWVSFQATSIAALLVLGGGVHADTAPARNAPASMDRTPTGSVVKHDAPIADPMAMDDLLADPSPSSPSVVAPSKPVGLPTSDPKAAATSGSKAKSAEKTLDPEPDAPVKPPSGAVTRDPLDALAPEPSKSSPKSTAATPDAGKPDAAPSASGKADTLPATSTPGTQAAVPDALPPVEAAIKRALDTRDAAEIKGANAGERRKERAAVAFFYASHGFAPIWSDKAAPVAAVPSVLARLAAAGDDALSLTDVPKTLDATGTPDAIAASDIALTEAVVAYARQASGSRVDPASISPLIGVKRTLADPAEVVDAVAAAGAGAGDRLRAVNPIDPRYVALRDQLAAQRGAAQPKVQVPGGPTLRIGMRDPRVPLVRARLGLDAPTDTVTNALVYDPEVAAAVEDFQRDKNLPVSGALTRKTVEAMSGGKPARLTGTLTANMEMWRWMPRDLGTDRIEVNVPDFVVTVFHDGQPMSRNRVVVGKIDTPTPLFSNTMKYLIVNPYWNVPQSIIKNELLPKGHGSLSYLDGRGYSVSSHDGMAVVKQLPGDKNALGRIKFLFPNDYSVYLHDTPSKALFSSAKRAFSHGCVRVDKPFAFAESVLNDAAADGRKAWSQDRLESMIGDKERYVNLPVPLPIHIEYFTASVDEGGAVSVRDDVYGYANAVAAALGQEATTLPIAGKVKPKPLVVEASSKRRPDREQTAAVAPPPASRGFWEMFDPR